MARSLFEEAGNLADAWKGFLEDSDSDSEAAVEPENPRCGTDQIVAFFEREYDGREDSWTPCIGEDELHRLAKLRTAYFNCTFAVDHQDEQIAVGLEELVEKRAQFKEMLAATPSARRAGQITAQSMLEVCSKANPERLKATKALLHAMDLLKLNVSDRKNTRYFKEKERQEIVGPLSALIAAMKTQKLLRDMDSGMVQGHDPSTSAHDGGYGSPGDAATSKQGRAAERGSGREGRSGDGGGDAGSAPAGNFVSGENVRRRRKRYTDEEISKVLKEEMY